MYEIGIMQGRLTPPIKGRIQAFPVEVWPKEFYLAREAGLDCIEWIFEAESAAVNPLSTAEGIQQILTLSSETDIRIRSVCADYYMEKHLFADNGATNQKNIEHLYWLVAQVKFLKAKHIVLPFVDSSSLQRISNKENLIAALKDVADAAKEQNIELHLEADLSPIEFSYLLNKINHSCVRVNFDIGNSASLGFNPKEELTLLASWLGSVHVKDRILGGSTVPLGTGSADFTTVFQYIFASGFKGHFILQAARVNDVNEVELAVRNRKFVESHLKQYLSEVVI